MNELEVLVEVLSKVPLDKAQAYGVNACLDKLRSKIQELEKIKKENEQDKNID